MLHKLLLDYPEDRVVDHINRNRLDNRRCNLRIVTFSENSKNCNIHKNNTSTVSGVNYRKDNGQWVVRIGDNNDRVYLGQYSSFEEAVKIRYAAEDKYGYLNDNNKKYKIGG